ncbi:MAG: hypothetical protein LAO19_02850 [Acidobacteriia bacterium]|nr:hypothetical protein [Terriglobia bacterium]
MKKSIVFLAILVTVFVPVARAQYTTGQQLPMTHMAGLFYSCAAGRDRCGHASPTGASPC